MKPIVVLDAFPVREALPTLRTGVRFLSPMRAFVSVEVTRVAELFGAL